MTAETLVGLIEELIDLKVQQQGETHLRLTPDLNRILHDKRETDRRRLAQIRAELVRILEA
jgi:hypothetical protein